MDVDIDEAKNKFGVDVFALVTVTQAFLPISIGAKDDIVNNSSLAGCPGWTVAFQGTYNVSKHAANSISDGMRVELAPFGVLVVNAVAGSIRSKFWENVAIPTIKEGSLYASVKKKAEQSMSGELVSMFADADVYVRKVVGDVLRSQPAPHVYRGAMVSFAWWLSPFAPYWMTDWDWSQPAELWTLRTSQAKK
jgi:1-acylglycerone phosphate reductase